MSSEQRVNIQIKNKTNFQCVSFVMCKFRQMLGKTKRIHDADKAVDKSGKKVTVFVNV